jgi:hypothetical protein
MTSGKPKLTAKLVQGVLLDQIGPHTGQIAFGQAAQTGIQQDPKPQD